MYIAGSMLYFRHLPQDLRKAFACWYHAKVIDDIDAERSHNAIYFFWDAELGRSFAVCICPKPGGRWRHASFDHEAPGCEKSDWTVLWVKCPLLLKKVVARGPTTSFQSSCFPDSTTSKPDRPVIACRPGEVFPVNI